jgi:hypothetical protein
LRRLFAVVKELIEWDLESTSHLLQGFNRGNGMTILDARDITPEKTRSLFDVTLGEFLVLAECAKAITNNHGCSPPRNRCKRVYCPLDIPDMYSCQLWRSWLARKGLPFIREPPLKRNLIIGSV